jgi:anti-sigma B factor antagonist
VTRHPVGAWADRVNIGPAFSRPPRAVRPRTGTVTAGHVRGLWVHQGDRPDDAGRIGDVIPAPTAYARTYRSGDITVVELTGEIDLGTAPHVDPHLAAAAIWPLVVLDLGPLEFIDCYGLSLLVRGRRRITERGGLVRMSCPHPPTRRLLAMTGLDAVFLPVRTLAEALRP